MGERLIGDLLEKLDKNYLIGVTYKELTDEGFSYELIQKSVDEGFVKSGNLDFVPETKLKLSIKGFLAVNQIRLKKSTDRLNENIKDLNIMTTWYSRILIIVAVLTLIVGGLNLLVFIF